MDKHDFHFELPQELIAQQPLAQRSASRLLVLDAAGDSLADRQIADLPDLLQAGDLLVCNDTRVLPARLGGHKESGGRVEILLERLFGSHEMLAQLRVSKKPRQGSRITLEDGSVRELLGRDGVYFRLWFRRSRRGAGDGNRSGNARQRGRDYHFRPEWQPPGQRRSHGSDDRRRYFPGWF